MYAIETFYDNICKLSKSLVIKFDLVAITMEISTNYSYLNFNSELLHSEENKKNMRFYRHIAGELYEGIRYSSTLKTEPDSEVLIKVIENETYLPLTKAILEQYPLTKTELLKFGDYYSNLVDEYPTMRLYIHGCLFPADIDKAVSNSTKDGTILSYNPTFVEQQEWSLMKELENFIKNYINRWYITAYTMPDNLYLQSFLGVLFSQIPNKIFNIRSSKIHTNEAHSFFLEAFFRSNLELWEPVQKLNNETIWWLYKNLPGIIKNIGKNETLDKLLAKVFNTNSVGIGGYYITRGDSTLNDDIYTFTSKPFESGGTIIKAEGLNSYYNTKGNGQVDPGDLINTQLAMTNYYTEEHNKYIVDVNVEKLNKGAGNNANTKVLEVSTLKEYTGFNVDKLRVMMDYWAFILDRSYYGSFSNSDLTTSKVEFTDPNTGAKFNINAKIGFYMVIKVMLHAVGALHTPIRKYAITTVCDPSANINKILKEYLYPDGLTELLSAELIDAYPVLDKSLSSATEVAAHITTVIEYYKNLWITSANAESAFVASNIRMFLFLSSLQEAVTLHPYPEDLTIDEILANEGITNFEIYGSYDHAETVKELIYLCLGLEVNSEDRLSELLLAYKEIIRKLTSYTLHPVGEVNEGSDSYIYNSRTNFIKMKKGILKLDESKIDGDANNKDNHTVTFIPYIPNEEIRDYDLGSVPAHEIKDFLKPRGVFLWNTEDLTTKGILNDNLGCGIEIITLPTIPTYETNYRRQYITWKDNVPIVPQDTTTHQVMFDGEREQVISYGDFDKRPDSRFKSTESKGVYENVSRQDNERQAITSLSDPLED